MRLAHLLMLLIGSAIAGPTLAKCGDMPWKFGMTPKEVSSVAECGPYKRFQNGDLETYAGTFDGKAENFQFFFTDGKLRRIGVYLYEGPDIKTAAVRWAALGSVLIRDYGSVETDGSLPPGDPAFVATALKILEKSGKTQMAPLRQPKDASVFSSFMRQSVEGKSMYYVILYFDARP